ncbi:MAG: HAD family phosphatase [Nitrospirota bacterium]
MIKAVIFDWGGVLIDNPASGLIAYCAKTLGSSDKEFSKVYQKFESVFHRGTISEDKFWEMVCSELNIQKPDRQSLWGDAFRKVYSPKKEMFSLASSLHNNGYKIGLLSNTEIPAMKYFYEQGYNMFDVLIFSCIEGIRKPEKRIYELTLERLDLRPEEVIFIDDKEEYINGAKIVGINTILFKSPDQIKKELSLFSIKTD